MKFVLALLFYCYFFIPLTAFASEETTEDEAMNFPDAAYAPPIEGELEFPWDKYFGYKNGFFIRTPDNDFSLLFNASFQARYLYSQADNLNDYQRFDMRRITLYFSGHFIDESWTYVLGTATNQAGNIITDDAYIAKAFNDYTWAQVGQFTTPFLRESLVSRTRQLTIERSLITKYFSTNTSTGTLFGIENEMLKWTASATNGYFQHDKLQEDEISNHDFQNGLTYAFISRLEFKPFGNWQEFRDFNSPGDNKTGLLIGVAGGYQRDNDIADIEEVSSTVDISFQGSGWSLFSMMATTKDRKNDSATSYGAQLQGGLFIDEQRDTMELFSRYEWGNSAQPDPTTNSDSEGLNVLTTGFNYYIYPAHLKLTTDFGYAFGGLGENWADERNGWRADPDNGQWVARTQIQLVI